MVPFIAGLLKAGLGLAANAALAKGKEYLEEKAGIKIDTNAAPTPEQLVAIQKATMEHEEEMAKIRQEDNRIDAEIEKAYLADRQDARGRDKEFIKIGKNNTRGDILAYLAVGALVADLVILSFMEVPRGNRDLLLVILGAMIAIVKDVYGFEFGSSKDSQRNAQAVVDTMKNATGN